MPMKRTLFDKLWDSHVILAQEHGDTLLWVGRHFVHEGSHHAFSRIAEDLTFGVADHDVPTRGPAGVAAIPPRPPGRACSTAGARSR